MHPVRSLIKQEQVPQQAQVTENVKEVDSVLSAYVNPPAFDPGACTRGLYLRGLE